MRSRYTTDGYLTVTLALVLTVLLSFVLAILSGARTGAARTRAECVTDIALDATLAEYNRALFDRYGLLFLDTSYGSAVADITRAEEHLRKYVQKNLSESDIGALTGSAKWTGLACSSVQIPSWVLATDGNCAVLRRQILEYMTAEPVENALVEATENLQILRAEGYDTRDVATEMTAQYAETEQAFANAGFSVGDAGEDALQVQGKRSLGVLTLAHPDRASISTAACTPQVYVSGRTLSKGNAYAGGENLSATERLLIDQYIIEKCGRYGAEREGSRLQYQLEYLIAGKGGDYENLEHVARRLLAIREASNFAYIMTDGGKKAAAAAIGIAVAALLLSPSLKKPVEMAVLFAWSFAESIADLRTLYNGGKVPLIKTGNTWKTSLLNILGFGEGTHGTTGLDYGDYLRMLLLMEDLNAKTLRLADVIEMDMRETPGNLHFRLDACVDHMSAEVTYTSSTAFSGTFTRKGGYATKEEETE
ncbi:MAG: hypothetical protein IJP92_09185, partial [Lachnospiraceae bacterium]|nr:hypothetical protein [Lachnospiraceae bacterium]